MTKQNAQNNLTGWNQTCFMKHLARLKINRVTPKTNQNMTITKQNPQQQVKRYLASRHNNNFRGFRRDRIPQYSPNGRRLDQRNDTCTGNQFQNYSKVQNDGFPRAYRNFRDTNNGFTRDRFWNKNDRWFKARGHYMWRNPTNVRHLLVPSAMSQDIKGNIVMYQCTSFRIWQHSLELINHNE